MNTSYSQINLSDEQVIEKLLKIKELSKTSVSLKSSEPVKEPSTEEQTVVEKPAVKQDPNKSLKELKEMAIVLRQKLDTLESEKNVMEVEYSQVIIYT